MINKINFIEKARKIHGNKYDYSKVEYKKVTDKVCIICPEHGEFWQEARQHYRGQGCPKCACKNRSEKRSNNTEEFIKRAREVHGNKYDYSKVEYLNNHTKVCIICSEHGEFWQMPCDHINNKRGCPKCGKEKMATKLSLTQDEFIKQSIKIHGNKYNYSKVEYKNNRTKVCIICPKHGEFWTRPEVHLKGCECPKCFREKQSERQTKTTENFIKQAKEIHGDKYNYSKVRYKNILTPITIICSTHGEFKQVPSYHLCGNGCPKCGVNLSIAENEIYEYCKTLYPSTEQSNRSIIKPYELDVYIPEINTAIEYNGLLWHSDKYKSDKNYHLKKLNACKENGIKLLQIFEDEYVNNKDIVFEKIKHILKKCENLPKIMGRKCEIKEIKSDIAKEFLTKYHIQGFVNSTIYIGSYYENKLIGVMTFKQEHDKKKWELTRFASNYNYICQGVGGKLFKYFIRKYNPDEIKSFADRRWTIDEENNIYLQLGFKFDSYTLPDYKYFKTSDGIIRQHKFGFRKERLHKKYGLPMTMTEKEMTKKLGYTKIYDCGLIKYIWIK